MGFSDSSHGDGPSLRTPTKPHHRCSGFGLSGGCSVRVSRLSSSLTQQLPDRPKSEQRWRRANHGKNMYDTGDISCYQTLSSSSAPRENNPMPQARQVGAKAAFLCITACKHAGPALIPEITATAMHIILQGVSDVVSACVRHAWHDMPGSVPLLRIFRPFLLSLTISRRPGVETVRPGASGAVTHGRAGTTRSQRFIRSSTGR